MQAFAALLVLLLVVVFLFQETRISNLEKAVARYSNNRYEQPTVKETWKQTEARLNEWGRSLARQIGELGREKSTNN